MGLSRRASGDGPPGPDIAQSTDTSSSMLCLVHGYALTGSGSNQWTGSIAEGLAHNGETVHLVCQERRPEQLDFVSEAFTYDASGRPTRQFRREQAFDGSCVVHRPDLDVLPTYVRPQATNTYMASILDLSEEQIAEYLRRNEAVLGHVIDLHGVTAVLVNHVVLMAAAVHRVCARRGIPYGVLPHGSAIEYVVNHDVRMHELAAGALASAQRIFVLSDELRQRIRDVFPGMPDASQKMVPASAGVDTHRFQLVERGRRQSNIAALAERLHDTPRGKSRRHREELRAGLSDDATLQELLDLIARTEDYPPKLPDEGLEERLETVDWRQNDVIAFVGKIIGYKGLPSLIAAFPSIAALNPGARLVIAGRGNLRGGLEAMVYALGDGKRRLVENLVRWGGSVEGETPAPFDRVERYFEFLSDRGRLDAYFDAAERYATPEHIIFTGYLEHDLLRYLFPCCDVAIFPSIVKEAAPLVVPESMASGCFPIGTDFAGMAASLDAASEAVPEEVARLMRLRPDPAFTVRDIVEHVAAALDVARGYREALRDVAVKRFDWRSVAASIAQEMREMADTAAT